MRKRILLWLCLMLLVGCDVTSPTEPVAPPHSTVSLAAQDWVFSAYSSGMPPQPSPVQGGGWYFDFPDYGSVNYIYTACCNLSVRGKTLHTTFEVVAEATYRQTDTSDTNPATVHLYLQKRGDTLQDANGRWWATNSKHELITDGEEVISISISLDYREWTNVFGQVNQTAFEETLDNLGNVGFTFGGQRFYGHGISLEQGHSRFRLLDYRIE